MCFLLRVFQIALANLIFNIAVVSGAFAGSVNLKADLG